MGRSIGCHIRFMVKNVVQDVNDKEGWGATGVLYRMGLTLIGSEARDYVLRYGNDNYAFGSMRKRYQAIARRINKRLCDKV